MFKSIHILFQQHLRLRIFWRTGGTTLRMKAAPLPLSYVHISVPL